MKERKSSNDRCIPNPCKTYPVNKAPLQISTGIRSQFQLDFEKSLNQSSNIIFHMFISIHQTHDKYSFGNDFIFITHLTREKQKSENISIDSRKIEYFTYINRITKEYQIILIYNIISLLLTCHFQPFPTSYLFI